MNVVNVDTNIDLNCPYKTCLKNNRHVCEECQLDFDIEQRILEEKLSISQDSSSTETLT